MKKLQLSTLFLSLAIVLPAAHAQAGGVAQTPSSGTKIPAYDVVSIKPNKSGSGSVSIWSNTNMGRYQATNVSLKGLLQSAYDIKDDLIFGIPGPIDSARFDIEAKIVDPDLDTLKKLNEVQRREMIRSFLVERFQMKAHIETKTLPVYEMVVIKSGPKFEQSPADGKNSPGTSIRSNNNKSELTAREIDMESLASTLFHQVHRTVIDKTGLTGKYDLALKWSDDDGSDPGSDAGPSIFTALQEQLGLRLQSAKGPVETLVVDHVEMPSAN